MDVIDKDLEFLDEKYRPKTLTDVLGNRTAVNELLKMVNSKDIQHLMFYGVPGTGKTSAALALINDILGKNRGIDSLELNASDERRIEVVRDKIREFAKSAPIGAPYKIVFLDEADSMQTDPQNALRRIMEKYSDTCRFIITCNNVFKMIKALQSRCVMFEFQELPADVIKERILEISEKENIEVENIDALVAVRDLRKIMKLMHIAWRSGEPVHVVEEEKAEVIKLIVEGALKGELRGAIAKAKAGDAVSVVNGIHDYVSKSFEGRRLYKALLAVGEAEYRLTLGTNSIIQLNWLLSSLTEIGDEEKTNG
jgi:replication factor C small subunit